MGGSSLKCEQLGSSRTPKGTFENDWRGLHCGESGGDVAIAGKI